MIVCRDPSKKSNTTTTTIHPASGLGSFSSNLILLIEIADWTIQVIHTNKAMVSLFRKKNLVQPVCIHQYHHTLFASRSIQSPSFKFMYSSRIYCDKEHRAEHIHKINSEDPVRYVDCLGYRNVLNMYFKNYRLRRYSDK